MYQEVKSKVEYDLDCVDAIDAKAGAAIALVGTLLTILGAVTLSSTNIYFKSFGSASIVLLVVAGAYAVLTFKPMSYGKAPSPAGLLKACSSSNIVQVKKRVIARWIYEFAGNKDRVEFKSRCLNRALVFLISGIAVLAVGIVVSYWTSC